MRPVQLSDRIYLLPLDQFHAYAYVGDRGAWLIDTGAPGALPLLEENLNGLGTQLTEVAGIVLTHHHDDHMGNAAEVTARSGCDVIAHSLDVPVIDGSRPGAPPTFLDWEIPIHQAAAAGLQPASPTTVHQVLIDNQVLSHLGSARVVHLPSHTPGSLALQFPDEGVLLAGDVVASREGDPIPGLFNVAPNTQVADLHRLGQLDVDIIGVGHGEPVVGNAAQRLRRLLRS